MARSKNFISHTAMTITITTHIINFFVLQDTFQGLCSTVLIFRILAGKVVSSRTPSTPGSLQRSRSDIDVNAAASAKSRMPAVPSPAPFSSAAALPPGSYASLGKNPNLTAGNLELVRYSLIKP